MRLYHRAELNSDADAFFTLFEIIKIIPCHRIFDRSVMRFQHLKVQDINLHQFKKTKQRDKVQLSENVVGHEDSNAVCQLAGYQK